MWSTLSQVLGIASICTWLCAQLPQIYENHRLKSVEGLSPQFLAIWILGDLSGLIGCVLTHQKRFQTILSSYYVCTDLVLCYQYWLYTRPLVMVGVAQEVAEGCNSNRTPAKSITFRKQLGSWVSVASSFGRSSAAPVGPTEGPTERLLKRASSQGLTLLKEPEIPRNLIGYCCAYLSACMYMVSRIPQIYHNMQRQSVQGVSPLLFCATLFGNVMYTSSIVCASFTEPDQRAFLLNELPYIVGSAGTILFDVVIFLQFYLYREKKASTENAVYARLGNKPLVLTTHQTYSSTLEQ